MDEGRPLAAPLTGPAHPPGNSHLPTYSAPYNLLLRAPFKFLCRPGEETLLQKRHNLLRLSVCICDQVTVKQTYGTVLTCEPQFCLHNETLEQSSAAI